MSEHEHWCEPCVKRGLKWGVAIWLVHWVLHIAAFVVWPAAGLWLLALL